MTKRTQHPTQISQERRVQARTSICGSFLKSYCPVPKRTDRVSAGWIGPKASSKSKIQLKWHGCGASAKTDRPWTTTSWADRSDSTTKRELWKKRNDRSASCISSVTRTICNYCLVGEWNVLRFNHCRSCDLIAFFFDSAYCSPRGFYSLNYIY